MLRAGVHEAGLRFEPLGRSPEEQWSWFRWGLYRKSGAIQRSSRFAHLKTKEALHSGVQRRDRSFAGLRIGLLLPGDLKGPQSLAQLESRFLAGGGLWQNRQHHHPKAANHSFFHGKTPHSNHILPPTHFTSKRPVVVLGDGRHYDGVIRRSV